MTIYPITSKSYILPTPKNAKVYGRDAQNKRAQSVDSESVDNQGKAIVFLALLPIPKICAWCHPGVSHVGDVRLSHGICNSHKQEMEREIFGVAQR